MAKNSKNFLVSTADVAFIHNGMLAFTGTTALNTSIAVSMEDQEVQGGKGNKTLYKYKYGRKVAPSIEMAEWRLEYIAANVGSTIFAGLEDVFAVAECVALTNGVGTLKNTPVGKVFVEKGDGTTAEIVPVGTTITVEGETDMVRATYQYNTNVKRININADSTPMVGELILTADKHNNLKGKVGEVQIDIPSFQLSGNFDITLEASGTSTQKLEGDALAVPGATCTDGDVYGYITEIESESAGVSVVDIAALPGVVTMAVNDTKTINVIGIKGGLYSNIGIDASECIFTSDTPATATVDEKGVIKAVATGTANISVAYGAYKDTMSVTVA